MLAIASGPEAYSQVSRVLASIPGRLVLFLFSWSLIHHMLCGIRHLIWDTGRGLDLVSIELFAWATIIGSTVLTILVWVVGYCLRGA
jgi:succinate dehydrogenase / fumarate reductase cytochrome b subunit